MIDFPTRLKMKFSLITPQAIAKQASELHFDLENVPLEKRH